MIALFSKTNGATIKNLKTAGTINYQIDDNSYYDVFVAGFVASAQSTKFENCTNETTITSTIQNGSSAFSYTGGICARCENCDFINCTNRSLIKSYAKLSGISIAYVGGIAGEAYSSRINNCSNSGNMLVYSGKGDGTSAADAIIGGIIGSSTNYTSVSECISSGNLFAYSHPDKNSSTYPSTSATGGIVGTGSVSLNNCSSTCTLYPTAYNGGKTYKGELKAY